MAQTRDIGKKGEEIAVEYLISKGFEIIKTNFIFSHGEIDIIAKKLDTIHFVEVKYRSRSDFGSPFMSVNKNKIRLVLRTTDGFFITHPHFANHGRQMDVISILEENEKIAIDYYENITQMQSW